MKVDLHIHTYHSQDSTLSPQAIVEAALRQGLGAIAVIDHNTIAGGLEVAQVAPFPVILGEEIKTDQGEIAGLYLSQAIPSGLSLRETIERIKAQRGLVYVPHPLDRIRRSAIGRKALLSIVEEVDIIEAFNSRVIFPGDNRRAQEMATQYGLLQGAGSDAHAACEIGLAYVEMPPFQNKDEFLAALREGKVSGRLSSPLIHLATAGVKIGKRLGLAS